MELQIVIGAGKTAEILAAWDWNGPLEDIQPGDFPSLPKGSRVRWAENRDSRTFHAV